MWSFLSKFHILRTTNYPYSFNKLLCDLNGRACCRLNRRLQGRLFDGEIYLQIASRSILSDKPYQQETETWNKEFSSFQDVLGYLPLS